MPLDFLSIMAAGRPQHDPVTTPNADSQISTDPSQTARDYGRVIGYHNAMLSPEILSAQPDEPPSYAAAQRPRLAHTTSITPLVPQGQEKLPAYTCTVTYEGTLGMKLEMSSPFETFNQSHWAEVYVVIRGTVLNIHQVKTAGFLSKVKNPDRPANSAGRLLKSYTLQHAEAGVATDHEKFEMVPRSQFTELLSDATLKQLKETDPQLFYPVRQYVMRLRLETGQFLFRTQTSTELVDWLLNLCTAIDIAPPLEDRTEPRYHTLPRRRRRGAAANRNVTVTEPTLVEEQERIFRQHYPHLSSSPEEQADEKQGATVDDATRAATTDGDADADGEELDLNVVRNGPETPALELPNPFASAMQAVANIFDPRVMDSRDGPVPAASTPVNIPPLTPIPTNFSTRAVAETNNFDDSGKWQPPHHYGPTQEARYRRRCLPSLCNTSKRSSDVVFYSGKRYEIDWTRRGLVSYPAPPPRYHDVIRFSQLSTADSAASVPSLVTDHNSETGSSSSRPASLTDQSPTTLTQVLTNSSTTTTPTLTPQTSHRPDTLSRTSTATSPSLKQTPKQTWRTRLRSLATSRPQAALSPTTSTTTPHLPSSEPPSTTTTTRNLTTPLPRLRPHPHPQPSFPSTRLSREHEALARLSAVGLAVHPALRSPVDSAPAVSPSTSAPAGADGAALDCADEEGFVELAPSAEKVDALEEEDAVAAAAAAAVVGF